VWSKNVKAKHEDKKLIDEVKKKQNKAKKQGM